MLIFFYWQGKINFCLQKLIIDKTLDDFSRREKGNFGGVFLIISIKFCCFIITAALRRQREARDRLERVNKERNERKDGAPGSGAQRDGNPVT